MAGFIPLEGLTTYARRKVPVSSISGSKGDLLALAVGATTWTKASSATEHWQKKVIADQDYTTGDTEINVIVVVPGMRVEAEGANNSNAAHNGDRMVLTDENTVNNSGTDSTAEGAVFIQDGIIGAAADKRITGEIVFGTGVNPDAA